MMADSNPLEAATRYAVRFFQGDQIAERDILPHIQSGVGNIIAELVRVAVGCATCNGTGTVTETDPGATEREHLEGLSQIPAQCSDQCVELVVWGVAVHADPQTLRQLVHDGIVVEVGVVPVLWCAEHDAEMVTAYECWHDLWVGVESPCRVEEPQAVYRIDPS